MYIVAGCNGAGKTTTSFVVLPELLHCREFVNADSIAVGLSPFSPEKVAIEAGRLMLKRIDELMQQGEDFAFETTLSTRSYVSLIARAKKAGYTVTLCYFWLPSPEAAMERVRSRVAKGGHHIPEDVIRRRYHRSADHFTSLYTPTVDKWFVFDNTNKNSVLIAEGHKGYITEVHQHDIWQFITKTWEVMEETTPRMSQEAYDILMAIRKSIRQLVETNAKLGLDMVVGDIHGNIRIVPATQLLAEYLEEEKNR